MNYPEMSAQQKLQLETQLACLPWDLGSVSACPGAWERLPLMYLFVCEMENSLGKSPRGTQCRHSSLNENNNNNKNKGQGGRSRLILRCVHCALVKQAECSTNQDMRRCSAELALEENRELYREI